MPEPIRVPQKDAAWVRRATPQEIHEALYRNELAVLLGGTAPIDTAAMARANTAPVEPEDTSQITREALKNMNPAEIVKAQSEGLLNDVLGIPATQTNGEQHA